MNTIRILLLALGVIGALIFGAAFVTSILNPGYVEEVAKEIIRRQVEKKVHEKVESLDAKFLSNKAGNLIKGHSEEIAAVKRQLIEKVPERIATIIAEMRNLDCECRRKIEKDIHAGFEWQIVKAAQAQERLTMLIRTKYMETAEKPTREFRIFTGTNALVFTLLALAAFIKRRAGLHLLPPAFVLVLAASICAYLYLFNQNWLHTIVFGDYVGFAYVGYMTFVFAFLCDILFNRARVTTQLLNATFNIIGSSLHVVPC